jgi:uncharacterized small protein (DUF1192 family)
MSSVAEIEQAIAKLSDLEFVELERRLAAERNRKWDQRIEADSVSGALDAMLREVEEDVAKPYLFNCGEGIQRKVARTQGRNRKFVQRASVTHQ